jgi:hypothetical protein
MTEYTNDGGASSPADVLVSERVSGPGAVQRHYRCWPPIQDTAFDGTVTMHLHVVVSRLGPGTAVHDAYGMPETFIFAADEEGAITSWSELGGSFRGEGGHEEALKRAPRATVVGGS